MAGGWTCDGVVQDQIEDSVLDALRNALACQLVPEERRAKFTKHLKDHPTAWWKPLRIANLAFMDMVLRG